MKTQPRSLSAVRQVRPASPLTTTQASQVQGGTGEFPWQVSIRP
jgi:hypothetical protein